MSQVARETTPPIVIDAAIGETAQGMCAASKNYWMPCITPDTRLRPFTGMTKAMARVARTVHPNMMNADTAMALG
ncbi:MAG TPA: hypothetical protein PK069_08470 [Methanolinea sp.]|nr:hypothetical protein [Methanolinea sp.]HQK55411.1 hypothetical protein [Methanolinea sp.]